MEGGAGHFGVMLHSLIGFREQVFTSSHVTQLRCLCGSLQDS